MTFSDIVTVLGAGAGILLLLAMVATPLLADRAPAARRRPRTAAASFAPVVDIPAQRSAVAAARTGGRIGDRAATVRHAAAS
ncbi:hypothetical protein [Pseudonocardia sp. KRD291]|uniref:hypothetical protein n=1 Tax=Pseudonocardia sp. KRD291 TaxID=2792007 RepID=UPI001C4A19A4|nr:hypothetical protein [Pseudonocardia sp. KRD291]MBW0106522.1 hypothetical protein [Pseudonocardia sp. KRD291]